VARGAPNYIPPGGNLQVTRVRNADEFWQLYQRLLADYRRIYKPLLGRLRDKYAGGGKSQVPPALDEALEFHTRTYVVNALLAALNWRLDAAADFGLPNLAPEIPVESAERGTRRFLDYLGFEHATNRPLLLVETKRPSSLLPELADSANRPPHAEALAMGLRGEKLLAEWSDWLRTLTDYVVSLRRAALSIPLRVVITNGEWLIAFLDPFDAFLETRAPDPNRILVFKNHKEIEEKRNDLFLQLEHQFVLGKAPHLTPGELSFHVRPDMLNLVSHGLRLRYVPKQKVYELSPVIHLAPVAFLRSRFDAWFRIEIPPIDFELPHRDADLPSHLDEVNRAAIELLNDIGARLGLTLTVGSLKEHYDNDMSFALHAGVIEVASDEYLIMTGSHTHYLTSASTVPHCPYHDWANSRRAGVAAIPGPIMIRSIEPRSFFVSGEQHHCAHRDVATAKSNPITADNRNDCGSRSGKNGQAFCEIFRFEQHLCCRTCAFEDVCTSAPAFKLPCQRPVQILASVQSGK
jgi:hypothetical protein